MNLVIIYQVLPLIIDFVIHFVNLVCEVFINIYRFIN